MKFLLNNLRNVTINQRFISLYHTMNRTFHSSSILTYSTNYSTNYSFNSSQLLLKIRPKNPNNNKSINNTNVNKGMAFILLRNMSSKEGQTPNEMEVTTDDEDLFHEPPRVRFGMWKVALTIVCGAYFGALFAMFGANFLEEYEIFVKGDDDEDD